MGKQKQVYEYTSAWASTESSKWTEVTYGDYVWLDTETEKQYVNKLGFNFKEHFVSNPNFYVQNDFVTHNEFCQFMIFFKKIEGATITHEYEVMCYWRIRDYGVGMFVLIKNIGDLVFLMDIADALIKLSLRHRIVEDEETEGDLEGEEEE